MKISSTKLFLFFLQVFLTSGILYIGLTYNENYAGEKIQYSYFSSYKGDVENQENLGDSGQKPVSNFLNLSLNAQKLIDEAVKEIFNPVHGAGENLDDKAYQRAFQDICVMNLSTCMKIRFKGDFDYKDKYVYLASIVRIVSFVDENSIFINSVSKTLEEVMITKDDGKKRGYSTWNTIVMNTMDIKSYVEFWEVFTHELGHIIDLGVIQGKSNVKDADFTEFDKIMFSIDDESLNFYNQSFLSEKTRNWESARDDFVSGYAMTNPFEDFAESFNAYINHNAYFKYLAKNNEILRKKYNFIANYFAGNFLNSNNKDLQILNGNISFRPYDTTKLK